MCRGKCAMHVTRGGIPVLGCCKRIQNINVSVRGRTVVISGSRGCSLAGSSHARSPTQDPEAASTMRACSSPMPSSTCSEGACRTKSFTDNRQAHVVQRSCMAGGAPAGSQHRPQLRQAGTAAPHTHSAPSAASSGQLRSPPPATGHWYECLRLELPAAFHRNACAKHHPLTV